MTMTRERIEELKRLAEKATPGKRSWNEEGSSLTANDGEDIIFWPGNVPGGVDYRNDGWGACLGQTKSDKQAEADALFIAASDPQTILSLLALAERALEPQGQALPELPSPDMLQNHDLGAMRFYSPKTMRSYGQQCYDAGRASQLALPAGPVPEGWKLVPTKPTEEMAKAYMSVSMKSWPQRYVVMLDAAPQPPSASPAVAQPVADEWVRQALEFYADETRYGGSNHPPEPGDRFTPEGFPYRMDVLRDHGKIARAALGQPAEEGGKS